MVTAAQAPSVDGRVATNPICEIMPDDTIQDGCEVGTGIVEAAPGIAAGAAGDAVADGVSGSFAATVGETFQELSTFWVEVPSPVLGECTDDVCDAPTAVTGGGTGENFTPTDTVGFVWDQTGWVIGVVLLVSIAASAIKLMWQQRGDAGRELLESLLRFVVVSSAGLGAVVLLTEFSDALATNIIHAAIDDTSEGFGNNFLALSGISALAGGSLGVVAVVVFGLLAILAAAFQVIVLIFRGALLVLVVGFLPLAAAATNTAVGRNAWTKAAGWILAFIVYKPVAALIYGAGFTLLATPMFDDDGPLRLLTGLAMLLLATLALPALIKLCVPAAAAVGSAGGNAMGWLAAGGAGAAALATGSGPVGGSAASRAVIARSGGTPGRSTGSSGSTNSRSGGPESAATGAQARRAASGSSGDSARHRSSGTTHGSRAKATGANPAAPPPTAGGANTSTAGGAAAGSRAAGAGAVVQGVRAAGAVTRTAVDEAIGTDRADDRDGEGPDGSGG